MFAKKFCRAPYGRAAKWALAALAIGSTALIAACGGGGGGAVQQPEPKQVSYTCPDGSVKTAPTEAEAKAACSPAKILSVTPEKDSYVAGVAFTGVTFTLDGNLGNFSATLTDATGAVFPTKISGTKTVIVAPAAPLAEGQYVVTLSGFDTAGKSFSATSSFHVCAALNDAGTACADVIPAYSNVTIAGLFGKPGIVTLAAPFWNPAKIETSRPILNLLFSEAPLADCHYLLLYQAADDGELYYAKQNPVTNVVSDYAGPIPAGYEFTGNYRSGWVYGPKWHLRTVGTPPYDYMASWAPDGLGGYVYASNADDRILSHLSATGVQSVLFGSTDKGSFTGFITISCTAK